MDKKTSLRIKVKNLRSHLDTPNLSKKIVVQIARIHVFKNAKNVMIFYPLPQEINLLELLNTPDKNFYLPRVKINDKFPQNKELEVCPYTIGDVLVEGKYKIKEPLSDTVSTSVLDLIIMPALAVDKKGNRLGYGGGYYDRFLQELSPDVTTIVPVSESQLFDEIPVEEHDIKTNYIVTEKKVYNIMNP